jgi:NAD(P)-dependent dehydrogenase (short-subunit alcohol dehydrogenase family)
MRIVVLGATGATGRLVVNAALGRGHEVVALARRPEALSDLARPGLTVRPADVHDPDTVTTACEDADAVISALGISRGGPATTLSAGARAVIAAKPPRLAWMGSFGVGHSRGRAGPLYEFIQRRVLGAGFDDKAVADDLAAGPQGTVFHPVMLTGAPASGEVTVVPLDQLDRSWRFLPPRVTRADVAAAMVAEMENPAYAGRTVAVY